MNRLLRCFASLLAVTVLVSAAYPRALAADSPAKRILLISTGSRLAPGFVMVDQHLLQALRQIQSPTLEIDAENLDILRFPAERAGRIFGEYLSHKYRTHPPDLIILIFVGNLNVTSRVLREVFPNTPTIVAGFSEEPINAEQFGDGVIGFAQRVDPSATLKLIARLHPDLQRLVVVGGTADVDRQIVDRTRSAAQAFNGRFEIEFLDTLPMTELRKVVTSMPPKSAILYTRLFRDGAGQGFVSSEVGRWIGQSANAPVYTLSDPSFGTGAVGGAVASVEQFGKRAGELARQILNGQPPSASPFELRSDTVPLFDWRALKRWGIDESLLPPGSDVRFRHLSVWEQYRWYIVGAIGVIVLQSAMIGMLILQRRDLRRVQGSLQQHQQLMELATEAGELGLWSRDVATGRVWANSALRSMLGVEERMVFQFHEVLDRVHPDDRLRVAEELQRVEAEGLPLQTEYRMQLADGRVRWMLVKGRKMTDPRGRDTLRIGAILDITERKLAEETLNRQRNFLRQVIDANPNFIFAKDRDGRFTLANQAVADAYGVRSPAELIGKSDADFNPNAQEVEFFRRMDTEVMDTLRERFIPEERLTDAHGRVRWLQTVKRPLIGADGKADQILGASTDITQRKRTETELHEQRAELAHVGRITMMGELAASLVHELNQPLTAILTNAQAGLRFMAQDPTDTEELREVLADIVQANKRAGEIIQGMRAWGRKDGALEFGALDLTSLVLEVARLAHGDAVLKNVSVDLEFDDDLPPVRGDRIQLQQVLLNILMNAFDAMRECEAHKRQVKVSVARVDSRLNVIGVSDHGPGLRGDALDKIFKPFYTTKRDGLGIGLSICRSIIKAHGGSLWAENNPEGGATFYFTVPVATQEVATNR